MWDVTTTSIQVLPRGSEKLLVFRLLVQGIALLVRDGNWEGWVPWFWMVSLRMDDLPPTCSYPISL